MGENEKNGVNINVDEEIILNIDILIYIVGSFLMAAVSIGFVFWALKTGQFGENEHLKRIPLAEDDEEYDS
jgi:cbb3-type cytochrome oxidase maturation protein